MARPGQKLAIIVASFASLLGYLFYGQDTNGFAQQNRVRTLGAVMKLNHLVGSAAESLGFSTRFLVTRKFTTLFKVVKDSKEDAGLQIENTLIENVPVRIVRPLNNKAKLPAIVFFHGGAFYMGSPDTHNGLTSELSRLANVVVISVDYRLAPEHPFPAGLDDCYTVAKYVVEHGDSSKLNIDRNRVALAGDSAGGNFAAVLSMRFATQYKGKHTPRLQVLIYPLLQMFDFMLPSYMHEHFQLLHYTIDNTLSLYFNQDIDASIYANNHTTVQQKKHYRKYVDWSLIPAKYRTTYKKPLTDNQEGDPTLVKRAKLALNPEASPLLAEDNQLAKLPQTYILSVGRDRLRDESFIYEGRLKKNGVSVVHKHYENTFHAAINFLYGPFALDIAHAMVGDIVQYLNVNL